MKGINSVVLILSFRVTKKKDFYFSQKTKCQMTKIKLKLQKIKTNKLNQEISFKNNKFSFKCGI